MQAQSPMDSSVSDEEAVVQVVRAFVRSIDYADWDSFVAQMADDANMFFPFAPQRANTKQEIIAVMRPIFERNQERGPGPLFNFVPRDILVQMLGDHTASVTWMMDHPDFTQRRTAVLRKDGGRWLILSFHGSNM